MRISSIGYLPRTLSPVLRRAAEQFPVVVLTGPRQSGKTTLLTREFGASHRYVGLDAVDVRASARADPRGFLAAHPAPVIIDEIQYAPDLLPLIKERVDVRRRAAGQYLLTGSHNLLLMERVSETLAGRTAVLRLLPLSRRELDHQPEAPPPWLEESVKRPRPTVSRAALASRLLRGGYPELAARPGLDARLWHTGYLQTYLERDVRTIRQVGDLTLFQGF
ncbi:MAG: AAA family ATPase, partial [bacterium]